jgi:hypothetical protein
MASPPHASHSLSLPLMARSLLPFFFFFCIVPVRLLPWGGVNRRGPQKKKGDVEEKRVVKKKTEGDVCEGYKNRRFLKGLGAPPTNFALAK